MNSATAGSSPLARGTYEAVASGKIRHRLIPARAGNMYYTHEVATGDSAHPRSRGEHSGTSLVAVLPSGSSPLARGT